MTQQQNNTTSEWHETTVGEFAPFTYGKSLRAKDRNPDGNVPVFGSNGIVGYHDAALTDGPTVIIGRKGTAGAVHYSPEPCWPIDTTFFITGDDPHMIRFKHYALGSIGLPDMNTDSAVPGLNRNAAHARELIIPPLPEQRRIAHILGTLDDKIELNRRMNETLDEMARAIFKDWFVDFGPARAKMEDRDAYLPDDMWKLFPDSLADSELGEIPNGWEVKQLGELCHKTQYGYTASAKKDPIGPKFLRITDINKKAWIDWGAVPHCKISQQDFEKYRLFKGDVLIARMADPGHGVMIEEAEEAVFASYLIRFRTKHDGHARFIQYWIKSKGYWQLVQQRGAGTTRLSLNAKVLSEFALVMPSDDLIEIFGEYINRLRVRVVANASESRTLAAMRDTLLPKLVSGEVRINT